MRSAEVVILGAGAIGASVAYHLAARGMKSIVVLDPAMGPGQGSTGRASGGFRAQFSTQINIRLSLLSRMKLRRFQDETGVSPGFSACGYLFVARTPEQLAALRAALAVQRAAGLREATEVGPEQIAALNPALNMDDVIGGSYCPTDGFLQPMQLLNGYVQSAQRLGVDFRYGCSPITIVMKTDNVSGRRCVMGVSFGGEKIDAGCVVNAAGPWAAAAAAQAGIDLPVRPVRRQVASTCPFDLLPEIMPMTVDVADGFHLRVRDGRVLLQWPVDTPGNHPYDTTFDPGWLTGLMPRARHRVPCLSRATIDRDACWAGLYEMTPDKHALLGPAPEVDSFYLANGSSGHGVMHSPALGHLLAEIIVDGEARTVNVNALRPSRFDEGRPNIDTGVL